MDEQEYKKTIDIGKKNLYTKSLIENWCSHARIEKAGGTGLIEMQTGFPIGHHFMICDHTPREGMATYDLADAAIAFCDKHCKKCEKRDPVGFPNLSILNQQNDKRRLEDKERQDQWDEKEKREQSIRQKTRADLLVSLNIRSHTVIYQLE